MSAFEGDVTLDSDGQRCGAVLVIALKPRFGVVEVDRDTDLVARRST
jgi:hypothetical protein